MSYIRTKEHREKMSKLLKGKNKGKKRTKEQKKRISDSLLNMPKHKKKLMSKRMKDSIKKRKEKNGFINSLEARKKLSNTLKKKYKSGEIIAWNKGKSGVQKYTKKTRSKISNTLKKRKENGLTKKLPETVKNKIRISRAKFLSKLKDRKGYNKKACKFFNRINKIFNMNGFHAENKGEFLIKGLGYFLDYYEPNLGLTIEWNEEQHYDIDRLKRWHIRRQNKIKKFLKCKFINIRQKTFNESKWIERLSEIINKLKIKEAA